MKRLAYSILQAIPNKLGGVIGLVILILILTVLPFTKSYYIISREFYPTKSIYILKICFAIYFINPSASDILHRTHVYKLSNIFQAT